MDSVTKAIKFEEGNKISFFSSKTNLHVVFGPHETKTVPAVMADEIMQFFGDRFSLVKMKEPKTPAANDAGKIKTTRETRKLRG